MFLLFWVCVVHRRLPLRVFGCAFCSISLLFVYMCARMPSSPRSIAGVPSLEPSASGLPYYCTPPVCVPDVIGGLAVWQHNNQKKLTNRLVRPSLEKSHFKRHEFSVGGLVSIVIVLTTPQK